MSVFLDAALPGPLQPGAPAWTRLQGPNQRPEALPDLKPVVLAYQAFPAARDGTGTVWTTGLAAAVAWAVAAVVTVALPDVVRLGSTPLFAAVLRAGAVLLAVLSPLEQGMG